MFKKKHGSLTFLLMSSLLSCQSDPSSSQTSRQLQASPSPSHRPSPAALATVLSPMPSRQAALVSPTPSSLASPTPSMSPSATPQPEPSLPVGASIIPNPPPGMTVPGPTAPPHFIDTLAQYDPSTLTHSEAVVTTVYQDRPDLGWPIYFDPASNQFTLLDYRRIGPEQDWRVTVYPHVDLKSLNQNVAPTEKLNFNFSKSEMTIKINPKDTGELVVVAPQSIYQLKSDGKIDTLYNNSQTGYQDGSLSQALFDYMLSLYIDKKNNFYIYDTSNKRLRKISPQSQVETLAGNGQSSPILDGRGSQASLKYVADITMDEAGNLYLVDGSIRGYKPLIRKVSPEGFVTTLSYENPDYIPLAEPRCIHYHKGELFICDTGNNLIRKLDKNNVLRIVAGAGLVQTSQRYWPDGAVLCNDPDDSPHTSIYKHPGCYSDGNAITEARFNRPIDLIFDGEDNLYVVDSYNEALRKITFPAALAPE